MAKPFSPDELTEEPNPVWRQRLGCIGAIVAIVMLIVAVPLSLYLVEMSRGRGVLRLEVQRLRARNAPLTTVELHERLQADVDPRHFQNGRELLAAMEILKGPAIQNAAKNLPFVGDKPEPPPLKELWDAQQEAEAYLTQVSPLLDLVERFAHEKVTVRYAVDPTPGIYTSLNHIQELRAVSRSLTLKFHVDLRSGRIDEAIQRIDETIFLGETIADEPFLIAQLVRMALIGMALQDIEYLLANQSLTDEQLAQLQRAVRQVNLRGGFQRAMDGERSLSYTATTWPIHMVAGNGPQQMSNEEIARMAKREPRNPGDAALMLSLFRRLQETGDESLAAAAAEATVIETELKQLKGSHRSVLHMHTLLLFPAVQTSIKAFQRGSARCDAADACLAAIRHRQAQGEWPLTLRQLVPQYLPAEPMDPYTGKPMVFKTFPSQCKVYSLGENQTDDGGTWTDTQWTDVGFVATWRDSEMK